MLPDKTPAAQDATGFQTGDRLFYSCDEPVPPILAGWGQHDRWQAIGVTTIGPYHQASDVPRQDAFAAASRNEWIVAAVSDGVGSCSHSHYGANLAVNSLVGEALTRLNYLHTDFNETPQQTEVDRTSENPIAQRIKHIKNEDRPPVFTNEDFPPILLRLSYSGQQNRAYAANPLSGIVAFHFEPPSESQLEPQNVQEPIPNASLSLLDERQRIPDSDAFESVKVAEGKFSYRKKQQAGETERTGDNKNTEVKQEAEENLPFKTSDLVRCLTETFQTTRHYMREGLRRNNISLDQANCTLLCVALHRETGQGVVGHFGDGFIIGQDISGNLNNLSLPPLPAQSNGVYRLEDMNLEDMNRLVDFRCFSPSQKLRRFFLLTDGVERKTVSDAPTIAESFEFFIHHATFELSPIKHPSTLAMAWIQWLTDREWESGDDRTLLIVQSEDAYRGDTPETLETRIESTDPALEAASEEGIIIHGL